MLVLQWSVGIISETGLEKINAAAGHGLLIVTDPSNMAWLTGYDSGSFYVHQYLLPE